MTKVRISVPCYRCFSAGSCDCDPNELRIEELEKQVEALREERDTARASSRRMHRKTQGQDKEIGRLNRVIRFKEYEVKEAIKMASDLEFLFNRKTNDMIARHAAQIVTLKCDGSMPKAFPTRVEVIDFRHGENPTRHSWKPCGDVELSLQDDGRTLKVFLK